ncbi:unnamed protein product [Polarella glacialis]|uniref:Uncharacterized protein n=1 Tax=Polarella glacialis TaxID=89957 RepID=A0A813GIX3_POLGL|nr:unnamed protein product [Polarella glacialis]
MSSPSKRSRPAALADPDAFHSAPPTLEGVAREPMPVKNTFINFSEQQASMPITAPGKFVGRLAGPTPSPHALRVETPQARVFAQPRVLQLTQLVGYGGLQQQVCGPSVMTPPMMSPKFVAATERSIPPPPQASPVAFAQFAQFPLASTAPPVTAAAPVLPARAVVPAAAPPVVWGQPITQGSVIQGGMSPPRFFPPAYSAGVMNAPVVASARMLSPPMHSPVCATPGQSMVRCFPATSMAGYGGYTTAPFTPTMAPEGMLWPATPF